MPRAFQPRDPAPSQKNGTILHLGIPITTGPPPLSRTTATLVVVGHDGKRIPFCCCITHVVPWCPVPVLVLEWLHLRSFVNSSRCTIDVPALSQSQSAGSCRSGVVSRGTRCTWLPPQQRRRRATEDLIFRNLDLCGKDRFTGRGSCCLEVVCTEISRTLPWYAPPCKPSNPRPSAASIEVSIYDRAKHRAEPRLLQLCLQGRDGAK